nr:DUF4157 domain-containing protein [Streptomyces tailanensis]
MLALQGSAGNAAVVQLLREAGHPGARERHEHGAGCGHEVAEAQVQRSAVHDVLRGGGRPLDDATRTDMEARLGADFSDVRVHDDGAARASAAAVGARAYTSGSHVVIGDGGADRHTLAHELTHVIQQRQGPVAGTDNGSGLRISDPSDRFEREAEANATRALRDPAPAAVQRQSADRHAEHAEAPGGSRPAAVQRTEAATSAFPLAVFQPGYASGDQFAIAAMLMQDVTRRVYITFTEKEEQAAQKIAQFYYESGIDDSRVRLVPASGTTVKKAAAAQYMADFPQAGPKDVDKKLIAVGGATQTVAQEFSDDMRKKVRAGWGLEEDGAAGHTKDTKVKDWLKGKGVDAEGKTVAILWSRFSGKNNEVHIEHDSSYVGMAQIIAGLNSVDLVLIVGDPAPKSRPTGKYGSIAAGYNNEERTGAGQDVKVPDFKSKVVDLTAFWQDSTVKEWGGDTRTGQFLVFDYLNRAGTARHLGFRSGNLEAMALLGFNVRYMEEPNSIGGSRMEAWHAADGTTETSARGQAPGYERLPVGEPPTRSGRYQKSLPEKDQTGAQKHADWHNPEKQEKEDYAHLKKTSGDPRGGSLRKGFADEDLANIDAYLTSGDSAKGLAPELIGEVKGTARKLAAAAAKLAEATKAHDKAVKEVRNAETSGKETRMTAAANRAKTARTDLTAAEASSADARAAATRQFRDLCTQYGTGDALRARNLYAPGFAHDLSPEGA